MTTTYVEPAWKPQMTLPVNGMLPGNPQQRRYAPSNRIGKLRVETIDAIRSGLAVLFERV